MQPIVYFDAVKKTYWNIPAVENLTLAIDPGQFVTLLGPSGCGKTTTLRMLGGFETLTSGEIYLAGKPISHMPPNKRNVNTVFQDYALFPHLNVARNIAFGLELRGLASDVIERRVAHLLELVGLGDLRARMPDQLSGGQRQRVALMRALALDPDVLLLDEPLSALDVKLRQQLQIELKSVQHRTGKTFIFVTHDQEEAMTMSDTIVVMNKGRIEQMGSPGELYARPASRFVADFFGKSNFIEAVVLAIDGDLVSLDWRGMTFRALRNGAALQAGETATAAIRSEAMSCRSDPAGDGPALKGRVVGRLFKGSHLSFVVALENGETVSPQLSPADASCIDSDDVWIGWREQDAVIVRS